MTLTGNQNCTCSTQYEKRVNCTGVVWLALPAAIVLSVLHANVASVSLITA